MSRRRVGQCGAVGASRTVARYERISAAIRDGCSALFAIDVDLAAEMSALPEAGNAIDQPVARDTANDVAGWHGQRRLVRGVVAERAQCHDEQWAQHAEFCQQHRDEEQLPDLDTDIEKQQSRRQFCLPQADVAQNRSKTEAVQ